MQRDLTLDLVISLLQRRQKGLETYGKPVDPDDLDVEEWLVHLTEEALDASQYGTAALEGVRKLKAENENLRLELQTTLNRVTELENELVEERRKQGCYPGGAG